MKLSWTILAVTLLIGCSEINDESIVQNLNSTLLIGYIDIVSNSSTSQV